jgi:hypothetical protein
MPLRRIISSEHTLEFTLECGHRMNRKPFTGRRVIPVRMGCRQCQTEAFQRFDSDQAYTRGRADMGAECEAFAICLIFCLTKVLMPPIALEQDGRQGVAP